MIDDFNTESSLCSAVPSHTIKYTTQRGLRFIILIGMLLLVGCQEPPTPTPISITEVVEIEPGENVVITRVLTPTPTVVNVPTAPPIQVSQTPITLDISMIGGFASFDPQRVSDDNTLDLVENMYVGLTNYNHRDVTIDPALAQSWQTSPDGLIWRFNLRDDVYWVKAVAPSTGILGAAELPDVVEVERTRRVTADDVVFALERACDRNTRTQDAFILFIILGCRELYEASEVDGVVAGLGVRALNDFTVEFRLTEPAPYFLSLTTLPAFRPIPRDRFDDPEIDWLDLEDFVSSGPYLYSPRSDPEAEPNPVTILQKNPFWPTALNSWADGVPKGNVELVNIFRFAARRPAVDLWEANLLDITILSTTVAEQYLDSSGNNLGPPLVNTDNVFYLGFNFDHPFFGQAAIRRAFSLAINRDELIEEVYGMRGLPMRHFTPPGLINAPPIDIPGLGFSPSIADRELRNVVQSCRSIGEVTYMVSASDQALQHAEALIQMWVENLGCEKSQFKIEQTQFGTLLANTRATSGAARPALFDLGWSGFYPDAHNWFLPVLHCDKSDNRVKRPCTEADQIVDQAIFSNDAGQRASYYRQAENLLFGENGTFPIAPLYVSGDHQLIHEWLEIDKWYPATFGGEQFDTYNINKAIKDIVRSQ